MAVKVSPNSSRGSGSSRAQVTVRTNANPTPVKRAFSWWMAKSKSQLAEEVLGTAAFLRELQNGRYRQASTYARLYGNMPLASFAGTYGSSMRSMSSLPTDRPTMPVITSCVDTLISRLSQSKPRPVFLTDNGDFKQRNLAKKLNNFIAGEMYRAKAHVLGELALRDAAVFGTGCLKIYEKDGKVELERVLLTELYVDHNDAFYGNPRSLYQLKLIDRSVLSEMFPEHKSNIAKAEQGFLDTSADASQTTSDQVIVVEAWHLPSGKDSGDGRHTIACSAGIVLDEDYTKQDFPFVFIHYSPNVVGFWGKGLSELLMGTQVEINKLLMTISASINLIGVPRVFVDASSKVLKSSLNNAIGAIVTYQGVKPSYEVAPCIAPEIYAQLNRLVEFAYEQSGVSALAAGSQKPAGLNSGEAIRSYNDLQSDRFAALSKRYDDMYVSLAYQMIDLAKEIADRDGKYETVYPGRNNVQMVDLPKADLLENTYVIQCYDTSSLPKEPAGRLQKVQELMQAGLISPQEGRRLLGFPDLEQVETLDNAAEERILRMLDKIIDQDEYTGPDQFTDLALAESLAVKYYNLYAESNIPAESLQLLVTFITQVRDEQEKVKQAAMATPPAGPQPMANPVATPTSDLLPNVAQAS